ncbi:hypothetical protein PGRAT_01730 [Paenibacillus graminis]|uniref:Uncharacterized protein n=1 Tax=Paenibacillus graminis TaxID=189425 RepID=A0A089M297_9BACL|nr:hypothetical protein PGRAT_01730 [Paenibacillus graminis]
MRRYAAGIRGKRSALLHRCSVEESRCSSPAGPAGKRGPWDGGSALPLSSLQEQRIRRAFHIAPSYRRIVVGIPAMVRLFTELEISILQQSETQQYKQAGKQGNK